jgi:hypothetical protein
LRGGRATGDVLSSPFAVAAVVLALYAGWITGAHQRGHDAYDFALVGQFFLDKGSSSAAIETNAPHARPGVGYDGQFYLFLAQDPVRAHSYMDEASYRYGRILYPLASRAASEVLRIGIPSALVGINVLAVAIGALALAFWLRRRGVSPWIALLFGLYPGVFVVILRDLADGIAYALVAVAVLLFDREQPSRLALAAALFALAVLTRETTVVFVLVWAAACLFDGGSVLHWRRGALFAGAALMPYVVYRGFLLAWLGEGAAPAQLSPSAVPFGGILDWRPWDASDVQQIYAVVLPGAFCLGVALFALWRRVIEPAVVAVAANALLYVVLVPSPVFQDFYSSLRVSLGVVTAFVLAFPAFERCFGQGNAWLFLPVIAWFSPWWTLLPLAFQDAW